MAVMTMTSVEGLAGTRMTFEEWRALPYGDDVRIQLIEGVIVVPPDAPTEGHQRLLTELLFLLRQRCPATMRVLVGPIGVEVPTRNSALEPDLVVLPRVDEDNANRLPLLVVEVLSPSTRGNDQVAKRRVYAAREVPSYWLLDPRGPALRVLRLGDFGEYVEVAYVEGDEVIELSEPFPVRVCPAELAQ